MTKIYAIGDIHGHSAKLDIALDRIETDGGKDAQIVFLGDYTDRGPDGKGVLDRLVQGQAAGRNWVFLKGNHDRMFEWFLQTPSRQDLYLFTDLS
ncbi:MAG: metallophosphoesterase, partial [Planktomarina sp.]